MFIELTKLGQYGVSKVVINVNEIEYITETVSGEGACVVIRKDTWIVKESYDEVKSLLVPTVHIPLLSVINEPPSED